MTAESWMLEKFSRLKARVGGNYVGSFTRGVPAFLLLAASSVAALVSFRLLSFGCSRRKGNISGQNHLPPIEKDAWKCTSKTSWEYVNVLQEKDYWPSSLKNFVLTSRSLAIPREQADLQKVLPDLHLSSLDNVLTQGMNQKKKHEVKALAAIVSSIARSVGASTVVDVGAGQGYLAQVLSFQCQLSVIAIDSCSHHGRITDARAERIKKHYAAKICKSRLEDKNSSMLKTVTCRILSTDMLKALNSSLQSKDDVEHSNVIGQVAGEFSHGLSERNGLSSSSSSSPPSEGSKSPLLLAGLHACGDLSVTMLRTFLECNEVKAVVSIGCCYNLLSEGGAENFDSHCGFPMSKGIKQAGLLLGKSSRDLACQSAERWKGLGRDAGLHNFELHAFRAAFQMVLYRYYPEILINSPAIGRQGKALRRQQNRRILESFLQNESTDSPNSLSRNNCKKKGNCLTMKSVKAGTDNNNGTYEIDNCDSTLKSCGGADSLGSSCGSDGSFYGFLPNHTAKCEEAKPADKYSLFERFCESGLHRLGLYYSKEIDFSGLWKEAEPFAELIGLYWSLRAALGPVLETILLLDRLLFLQEQDNPLEAVMLPIFDPTLSPRNVALIAKKVLTQSLFVKNY
ncbi:protein RRNAD1-like [Camellia sinensis]|uniref:protein RRNAD1-like n=2 Tax=Camellia sinensis TaxID=4442 RepID=UPI001035E43C|nr:protein RRNAD1-like [Camellia sinensis]